MSESAIKDEARALLLSGCERWVDQWEHTEGSVLTGWLVIVETVRPGGSVDVTWATGNGMPTAEDLGGLPRHRADSLARQVSREIDAMEVERYRND